METTKQTTSSMLLKQEQGPSNIEQKDQLLAGTVQFQFVKSQ